jgi:hypothetical protein
VIVPAVATVAMLSGGSFAIANAVGGGTSPATGGPPTGSAVTHSIVPPSIGQLTALPPSPPPSPAVRAAPVVKSHHVAPALRINDVHGPCYVQVSHRGRLIERTILRQGHQLVFRRHGLDVVLGNAGAVRLRINGRHASRPGRLGQVRVLHVR